MLHERNTDEEDFMQEAESAVSSTLEPCSIRYCIALMKELKMELQKNCICTDKRLCACPFYTGNYNAEKCTDRHGKSRLSCNKGYDCDRCLCPFKSTRYET